MIVNLMGDIPSSKYIPGMGVSAIEFTLRCLIDTDSVLINFSQKIQPPWPYSSLHAKKIGDQILVKMDYLFIKLDHPHPKSC